MVIHDSAANLNYGDIGRGDTVVFLIWQINDAKMMHNRWENDAFMRYPEYYKGFPVKGIRKPIKR